MSTPRALRLVAPRTLELVPAPAPPPGPGEVRLRAVVSALSHGTELHHYRGTAPFRAASFDPDLRRFVPRSQEPEATAAGGGSVPAVGPDGLPGEPLGYELVGEVVEAGPGVEVAPGTLVHAPVPHAEEVTVPLDRPLPIGYPAQVLPAGVDPEAATLLSLTAVALVGVHDARVQLGDEVVVSGLGAIGLIAVQLARASGARVVIGVDPVAERRELAVRLGADRCVAPAPPPAGPGDEDLRPASQIKRATGRTGTAAGVDVVIETSGADAALHEALAAVRVGGTVVSVGFVQGGAAQLRLGEEWHHNRPQLVSSMGVWDCPHRDHPRWDRLRIAATARSLLADGTVAAGELVSHRVPFTRANEAYRLVDGGGGSVTKVLLTYAS